MNVHFNIFLLTQYIILKEEHTQQQLHQHTHSRTQAFSSVLSGATWVVCPDSIFGDRTHFHTFVHSYGHVFVGDIYTMQQND